MKFSYKKPVDKLNSKINKYTVFGFCTSIILLVVLLYLFLDMDHFINLTYFIVPVVALASLYIVYLSIDVMQAGNKFAEGMLGFERLKHEIDELQVKGNKRLFPDYAKHDIQKCLSCDVSFITYKSFSYLLNSALCDVRNDITYRTYLIGAQKGQFVPEGKFEEANWYVNCLMQIEDKIQDLRQFYQAVSFTYITIAWSNEIVDSQKRELFLLLDDLSFDYITTANNIKDGKTESLIDLLQTQTFRVMAQSGELSEVKTIFNENFLTPLEIIQHAKSMARIFSDENEVKNPIVKLHYFK